MAGRRRGARSGRGWDALPPRAPRAGADTPSSDDLWAADDPWTAAQPGTDGRGTNQSGTDSRGTDGRGIGRSGAARRSRWAAAGIRASGARPDETTPREPGEVARDLCLKLLAVRPRTRTELATALRRQGIPEDIATEVLDRYDEVGLVDDAAFARAWVTSRHHGRGLARRALASELRQRGVAAETVGEALDELDGDTEAATARELVDRRLRTGSTSGEPEAMVRRLVGMLARKGYPPGLAFRVVKEALADRGGREAELADQLDADALADAAAEGDAAAQAATCTDIGHTTTVQ